MDKEENVRSSKDLPLPVWLQNYVKDVIQKTRLMENEMLQVVSQYVSTNEDNSNPFKDESGDQAIEAIGKFHRILSTVTTELKHQSDVVTNELKLRFPKRHQEINHKINSSKSKLGSIEQLATEGDITTPYLPSVSTFARQFNCKRAESPPNESCSPTNHSSDSSVENRNQRKGITTSSCNDDESENASSKSVFEFETQAVNLAIDENIFEDSQPQNHSDTDSEKTSASISNCQLPVAKTDQKLSPGACFVPMEKLTDTFISAKIADHKKHISTTVDDTSDTNSDEGKDDDALSKALKQLKSFCTKLEKSPLKKDTDLKKTKKANVSEVRTPVKRKQKKRSIDKEDFRRDRGSSSDTDSFPENFESQSSAFFKRNIQSSPQRSAATSSKLGANDSSDTGSDTDCYLDGEAELQCDVENSAKKEVLKNTRVKKIVNDDDVAIKSSKEKAERGKNKYFTPAVCRIPNRIDSEASDSDASSSSAKSVSLLTQFPLEPENPRPLSKRTNVIRSDSSGSDSESHKSKLVNKEKEGPDIINVESDSDGDDDVLRKRKRSITKRVEDITTDEDVKEMLDFKPSPKSKADTKKAIKKEVPDKLFRIFTPSNKEKRRKVITILDLDSDNEDFQDPKRMRFSQSPAALNKFKNEYDSDDSDIEEVEVEKKSPLDEYRIDDSDDELESPRKKGRRNIRGIMTNNTLTRETQVAEIEEEERKLRLAKKQAKFNATLTVLSQTPLTIDDRMGPPVQELILDIDTSSKMPVSVDISIAEKLKPHQVNGVKFMWETCFESVEQYNKPNYKGSGCILAHCMGLGKTLQTVTFVHTVLTAKPLSVRTVLIVTPLNTVVNWQNEFRMWLKRVKKPIKVHASFDTKSKGMDNRVAALERWQREGGVGIMHYEYFRSLVTTATKSKKNIDDSHLEAIEKCLLEPGPDLIICDEGHLLKNHESGMSVAINRIQTKRRVVLTGTPLQNNLMEYHTMMQFVKPSLLGSRKEFANRFANPIKNGQHKDSGRLDVSIMKRRAHVLHKLLDGCVQRLDYTTLLPYLPEKQEYTVILNVSPIQKKLYNHYLDLLGGAGGSGFAQDRISDGFFLGDFAAVSRIWSHPLNLNKKTKAQKLAGKGKKLKDDGEDFDDEVENINDTFDDVTGDSRKSVGLNAKTLAKKEADKFEKEFGQWWSSFFNGAEDMKKIEHGSKCVILMEIIKASVSQGDKILVFSQYLYSLDMIEELLSQLDKEAMGQMWKDPRKPDGNGNRWRKGVDYFRIDGSVKGADRQRDCDSFNKESSRAKLFLISTRAGGLGINLVGANRVVLFDASFNPSNDMQGIFRVFRFGQKKKCYIYRLIARGTMEEKVYNRQVVKLSLAGRVVDEHQINRHFSNDELVKMYNKIEDDVEDVPVPSVPKDSVLANLLMSESYQNIVYKYLEHDSLLTNQVDEKLTDEERRLAWQEFEAEKKGRVPIPDISTGFSPFDDIVNVDGAEGYDYNDVMVNEILPLFTSGISQGEGETIIRRSIEKLYPNQTESEKDLFCTKVKGDLQIFQKYSDNPGAASSLGGGWAFQLSNLRDKISSYLTIPNFLRRNVSSVGSTPFVKPLAAKNKQRKPNTTGAMHSNVNITPVPHPSASAASHVLPNRVSSSGLLRSNSPGSRIMNPVQPSMFRSAYGSSIQPQQPKYFQNMANKVGENVGSAAGYRDRPSIPGYAGAQNAPIPLPPVRTAPAYAGIRNAPIPLPPVPTATSSMGGVVSTPKFPALSQSKSNGGRRKDGF